MAETDQLLPVDRRTLLRSVGGLGVLSGTLTGGVATLDDGADDAFTVTQGDTTTSVEPLGEGTRPVDDFYGGDTGETGDLQPNTGLEEPGLSRLFLYRGAHELSLVVVHAGRENRAGGASYTISGLPSTGDWAVLNEAPGTDADFAVDDRSARLDWAWEGDGRDGRGAGAAFRGLGDAFEVHVEAAFDGEGELASSGSSGIDGWEFLSGDPDGVGTTRLSLGDPITVRGNDCGTGRETSPISEHTVALEDPVELEVSVGCNSATVEGSEYDTVSLNFVDGVNERFHGPFTGANTFSSTGEYTSKANEIIQSVEVVTDGERALVENRNMDACLDSRRSCESPYDF